MFQKAKKFPEMSKALDSADQLSKSKEEKAAVLFMRGAMLDREKKFDLAEKTFRQVLDSVP